MSGLCQFDHYFREYPNTARISCYCINAGLEGLLDWMKDARFLDDEIEYLRSQKNHVGGQVFSMIF